MKTMKTGLGFALALALAIFASACSSDASFICERRRECVTSTLDVDACITAVENFADESATNDGKVVDCAACLDGKACSEVLGACLGACIVVPAS
jgi:hypothetical protein